MDRDIMWKYRKAGVVHAHTSVSQKTLDFSKKDPDVDVGKVALDLIHEQGIITETSFVLGFPDEPGSASSGYLSSPSTATRTMPTSWPSPSGPMPTCTAKLSRTSGSGYHPTGHSSAGSLANLWLRSR
jgi:hypothetical protein